MIGNLILALGVAFCAGAPLVSDNELQPKNVDATNVSVIGSITLDYNDVAYECYSYGNTEYALSPTIADLENDSLNPNNYSCVYVDNAHDNYIYLNRTTVNPFGIDEYDDFINSAMVANLSHDFPIYWKSLLIRRNVFTLHKVYFETITYFAFYKDVITYNGSNYVADAINIGFQPAVNGTYPLIAQLVSVFNPSSSLGGYVTDSNYAIYDAFLFSAPVFMSNTTLTGDDDVYYCPYAIHTIVEMSTSDYEDIDNSIYFNSRLSTSCDLLYNFNASGYGGYYYQIGFSAGEQNGYTNGYAEGLATGSGANSSIKTLFGVLADTPIRFLKQMFNFEVFGMNVAVVILSCLTAVVVFTIVKKVWK